MKKNLFGLMEEAIREEMAPFDIKPFRARQLIDWMYGKSAVSFDEMTNLGQDLRYKLAREFSIDRAKQVERWDSADGKTIKFLLGFPDEVAVESVLMRQPYGNSICISTQAGCAMGCAFCASTLKGLTRDLVAGEMLAQVFFINDYLAKAGEKVDTMVLMGSGEPLYSYANVLSFLRLIHESYCLNFGYRNVTLSTCGIVERIYDLAHEKLPVGLAISLHAPNDEIRRRIMPIARKYPIKDVVKAGEAYFNATGRRVTYEYILIDGVNDSRENARELGHLLAGQNASVNLIPINPVVERCLRRPSDDRVNAFAGILHSMHITATVRKEMGADINAACGQLRNRHLEGK